MKPAFFRTLLSVTGIVYAIFVISLISLYFVQVFSPKNNVIYYYSELRVLNAFEYSINGRDQGKIELPATIENLNPGDVVTLQGVIESRMLDNILIKVNHSFFKLYINNVSHYTIGSPGTYPEFQKEPPGVVTSIALPSSSDYLDLRLEYTVPEIRTSLTISEMYVGDKDLLLSMLVEYNMFLLVLSVLIFIAGVIFVIIGFVVIRKVPVAGSFIWLGLTCLATSAWTACSNEIVLYLLPQPALLYNFEFIGLFGIIPAFLRFNCSILNSQRNWLIRALCYLTASAYAVILLLHLVGVFSFAQALPIFYLLVPIVLAAFVVAVLMEQFRYKNPMTLRFIISCSVLIVLVVLELVNEELAHFVQGGLFFQIGLAFFVFELSMLAWEYVGGALAAAEKNVQLQLEIASTNRVLGAQRALYETLATSNEEVRKIRHDMHHQLNVIRGFLEEDRSKEASEYLDGLYGVIPSTSELFICDNFAANALAAHYLAIAKGQGIQVDLKLEVPKEVGRVSDSDLCIVIGNLFENAIEACGYVDEHKRFINITSSVDALRFKLALDNSYDGHLSVRNGEFYSRKRSGKGIGMSSVRAVVKKYEGTMKYETADGVFKASLYVKL